jgi:hypothetical protein
MPVLDASERDAVFEADQEYAFRVRFCRRNTGAGGVVM